MLGYITSLAVLFGVASAGVVLGGIGEGLGVGVGVVGGGHHVVDVQTPPRYEFKYGVEDHKSGDRKQQSEVRVNDVVKGEYSLAEPDGTIRVVKYTADDHNGFNAVVSRVGHAVHPQVLIRKAVVPVAHSVAVPVAAHGITLGGIGLGGGLIGGHGGILEARGLGLEGGILHHGGLGLEGGIIHHGGLGLEGGILHHGGLGLGGI